MPKEGLLNSSTTTTTHQIDEINRSAIVSTKNFTKEKDGHKLMLSIRFPGVFAGIKRQME